MCPQAPDVASVGVRTAPLGAAEAQTGRMASGRGESAGHAGRLAPEHHWESATPTPALYGGQSC